MKALAQANCGAYLSLGGGVGLLHYLDYRATHDVDAWWMPETTALERQQVIETLQAVLRVWGEVRLRVWSEVTSIELLQEGRSIFSFQIAQRSAQLEPSGVTPWVQVQLDSLADLVASKMVALVERGAPRDFRDIYAVCEAGLYDAAACWQLWERRQTLSGSDCDHGRARLAVETHLKRIMLQRPLAPLAAAERATAQRVRAWYLEVFLHGLP